MDIEHRAATADDIAGIVEMYGPAEGEQTSLRELWGLADGLAEPLPDTLQSVLDNPEAHAVVGLIDGVVFGFAYGSIEDLLPQAGGERIGVIRIIYVDHEARMVGVGEEMLEGMMGWFRSHGLSRFDAIVSPGHRLAKNFFEAAGFKARRITMYRRDE
jgi:GNAT superfamily N-acetyltransferase